MRIDEPYLTLIRDSINQVFIYVDKKEKKDFLADDLLKDACLTRLMVIGEYGNKVSQSTKDRFPEVEWQLMKVARNFYIHAYDNINWERVWETIMVYLPPLKPKIENIISIVSQETQ